MRSFSSGIVCALSSIGLFAAGCGSSDTNINPLSVDAGADASVSDSSTDASNDIGAADTTPADSAASDTGTTDGASDSATTDSATDASTDVGSACLASPGSDAYFTLVDATKCVVARYTADTGSPASLTWGRHGGPLGFDGSNFIRWTLPSGTTGALTSAKTPVVVSGVPSGAFWGSQALDLPFFTSLQWTAIAYSGSGAAFPGELVIIDGTGAVANRYDVNGYFSETAIGVASGRLLYTGLSPLSATVTATNAGALYAADTCGTTASDPRLLPKADTSCADPLQVDTWEGGSSGPVASDAAGDVFAILSTFGGKQELRGFGQASIARGQKKTKGTTLFSMGGFTSELAADGSAAYFQSNDATFTPQDPQLVTYTAGAADLKPVGTPSTLLTLKNQGTAVALLVDDKQRLWVGVPDAATGDAGPTTSTFFVLASK